jgi:hypothetical protein
MQVEKPVPDTSQSRGPVRLGPLVFLTLVAVLLVCFAVAVLPWRDMFPDFICYFSAGEILAAGHSPYDVERQTTTQAAHGWNKQTTGRGKYDFLPYYYPPWFGLLWVPIVPLGYTAAKLLWFFVNVETALVAAYLLRPVVPRAPRWVPVVLAACSLFTLACVFLGQTAILVLFLAALSWRLLEGGWDRSAGVALAWLTIKPQPSAVLLLAVMLRLVYARRWKVVGAFAITLLVLALVSTFVLPSWLIEMLRAPRETPSPTEHYPWIGNAWFLVLKAVGLSGWLVWALYLVVAVPFLALVVRAAFRQGVSLLDLMSLSVLAAFFVAPYARHYDFCVLTVPLLALLRNRLAPRAGTLLALALVFLPYVQLILLGHYKPPEASTGGFLLEGTLLLGAGGAGHRMAGASREGHEHSGERRDVSLKRPSTVPFVMGGSTVANAQQAPRSAPTVALAARAATLSGPRREVYLGEGMIFHFERPLCRLALFLCAHCS